MIVTCNNCGWVSFEVTRQHAEEEVRRFNEYFNSLSPKQQQDYYGGKGAYIELYERCFLCDGSYKNFRDSKTEDYPEGATLSPIIKRYE